MFPIFAKTIVFETAKLRNKTPIPNFLEWGINREAIAVGENDKKIQVSRKQKMIMISSLRKGINFAGESGVQSVPLLRFYRPLVVA